MLGGGSNSMTEENPPTPMEWETSESWDYVEEFDLEENWLWWYYPGEEGED